ncbi:hypothetical protein [Mycetocola zhujimingii]|uniref:hypothetical protein n=1 Tax=Mycetocola zhujimingii TaxID=2079792 RepID=UPI0013C443F7|nr:hypothetical protein [Mycetocola zhujimingii]
MTRFFPSERARARVVAGLVVVAMATLFALSEAAPGYAENEDRTIHLSRLDGGTVDPLFDDWVMVPGDKVSTTVIAHRSGQDDSTLFITLAALSGGIVLPPTAVEEDVLISIHTIGADFTATASELMTGGAVFDLGRSAPTDVPIEVTLELPFSSSNSTMLQTLDLSLIVRAADILQATPDESAVTTPAPTAGAAAETQPAVGGSIADGSTTDVPFLSTTGASPRNLLIVAIVASTIGLLFLGGRRKSHSPSESH